jgi:hypothetical protein
MRDPNNLIPIQLNDKSTILHIRELPPFDIQDYDLFDDKSFKKFMKDLERMVRHSIEYQMLIQYLRENMDMNKCCFYENVTNEETSKIKIHLHHDPLSLYDICLIVFNKRVAYNEPLEIELVAKEVMYVHYYGIIGLISVSETPHQLIHNGYLFVPTDKVLGNYKKFVDLYRPFFPPEQLDILQRIEEMTYKTKINYDILEKSELYVEFGGGNKLPTMDTIRNILNVDQNQHTNNIAGNEYTEQGLVIPAVIVKKEEK